MKTLESSTSIYIDCWSMNYFPLPAAVFVFDLDVTVLIKEPMFSTLLLGLLAPAADDRSNLAHGDSPRPVLQDKIRNTVVYHNIITVSPAGLSHVNGDGQCNAKMINFNHLPKSQLWIVCLENLASVISSLGSPTLPSLVGIVSVVAPHVMAI